MFELNEYSWRDVEIAVNGRVLIGALGIDFSDEVERELIYGKGNLPLGINDGNVKYEGEVTLHQSELEKLIQATGNKGALGLRRLTISLAYANEEGRLTTRTLVNVAINKVGEAYKQGDKFAEITVPFIFQSIIY